MSRGTADDDVKSIDAQGFADLEHATGIAGFTLDEDSRHRLEWALFWARTNTQGKEVGKLDIANLIIELAVQFTHAARTAVLAPEAEAPSKGSGRAAKDIVVSEAFYAFVRKACAFVPEAARLSDAMLRQAIQRALSAAKRQKDDPKSRMPPERRDELHRALTK